MRKTLGLAEKCPGVFALIVTIVLYLLMTGANALGAAMSGDTYSERVGQTLGMLIATACLAFVLWRLGWLETSGFARLGGGQAWLAVPLPIV